jgi:hypothetical protein
MLRLAALAVLVGVLAGTPAAHAARPVAGGHYLYDGHPGRGGEEVALRITLTDDGER